MEQDGITRFDVKGAAQQILHRHPLQHHPGGLLIADSIGQFDQPMSRDQSFFSVCARRQSSISNALSRKKFFDTLTDSLNDSRPFHTGSRRQIT
jgi:hypothetical protein